MVSRCFGDEETLLGTNTVNGFAVIGSKPMWTSMPSKTRHGSLSFILPFFPFHMTHEVLDTQSDCDCSQIFTSDQPATRVVKDDRRVLTDTTPLSPFIAHPPNVAKPAEKIFTASKLVSLKIGTNKKNTKGMKTTILSRMKGNNIKPGDNNTKVSK